MQKIFLFLLFPLTIIGQTQMGSNIFPELPNEEAGWHVSMSADGRTVAIGANPRDNDNQYFARARVYSFNGQDWIQKGQPLLTTNRRFNREIRTRVSLSDDGNILAISSPYYGTTSGGTVWIFQYKSPNWEPLGNYFLGGAENALLGYSISMAGNGNILAMVAAGNNTIHNNNYGSVSVRQFDGSWWNNLGLPFYGYFNSEGHYSLEQAVVSLSGDGTILVIGTPAIADDENYKGEVRIYKYTGGTWVQRGESIFSDEGFNFGSSVAISSDGNTIATGKISNTEMGYVRVFEFNNDQWIQKGVKLYGDEVGDSFGASVTISDDGTVLAVGAPQSNVASSNQKGLVKLFKFTGNNWSQIGIDIIGSNSNDLFGQDVVMSSTGDFLAIASPYQDNPPYATSGNVNVYDLSDILSTKTIETKSFSLYPNPAQKFLNISLEEDFELTEVNIYNSIGQLIIREKSKLLDISELAVGTYYIQIISPRLTDTKMFIKN